MFPVPVRGNSWSFVMSDFPTEKYCTSFVFSDILIWKVGFFLRRIGTACLQTKDMDFKQDGLEESRMGPQEIVFWSLEISFRSKKQFPSLTQRLGLRKWMEFSRVFWICSGFSSKKKIPIVWKRVRKQITENSFHFF